MRIPMIVVALAALSGVAAADSKSDDKTERVEWGFGARVRRSHASVGFQKLFVGGTPGSATQDGAGIEFTRRTHRVELVIGIGYDPLDGRDGYYLEKGKDPIEPGTVDYYEFDDLKWLTFEITAISRLQLHKILGIRFGAGIGAGVIRGEVRQTDALCTSERLQRDCIRDPAAQDVDKPVDLWPVMPVVNVLVGVEFRPIRAIALFADVGFHTVPNVSAGATFYLW